MKRIVFLSLFTLCLPYIMMAQRVDDDLYYTPKKQSDATQEQVKEQNAPEPERTRQVNTTRTIYVEPEQKETTIVIQDKKGKIRDVDEYNRRYDSTQNEFVMEDDTLFIKQKGNYQLDGEWVSGFDGTQDDYEYAERIIRFRNPRYAIHISSPYYWDVVYGMNSWNWNVYTDGWYAYAFPTFSNRLWWDWRYGSYGFGWGWNNWYSPGYYAGWGWGYPGYWGGGYWGHHHHHHHWHHGGHWGGGSNWHRPVYRNTRRSYASGSRPSAITTGRRPGVSTSSNRRPSTSGTRVGTSTTRRPSTSGTRVGTESGRRPSTSGTRVGTSTGSSRRSETTRPSTGSGSGRVVGTRPSTSSRPQSSTRESSSSSSSRRSTYTRPSSTQSGSSSGSVGSSSSSSRRSPAIGGSGSSSSRSSSSSSRSSSYSRGSSSSSSSRSYSPSSSSRSSSSSSRSYSPSSSGSSRSSSGYSGGGGSSRSSGGGGGSSRSSGGGRR